jgi:hypothetical protein
MSNQPLAAHPIPGFFAAHTLGLLPALEADINNEDRLIIPAPAADPNGSVARVLAALATIVGTVENDGGGALAAGAVQLVFKMSNSREIVLAQNAGGEVTGDNFFLVSTQSLVIPQGSLGVYLRVAAAPTVKLYVFARDVRADVVSVELSSTNYVDITAALKAGETASGVVDNPQSGNGVGCICNFGAAPRIVNFRITNPSSQSLVVPISIGAGVRQSVGNFAIGAGWKVEVALDAVPDINLQLLTLSQKSNASPVRSNQGGAY